MGAVRFFRLLFSVGFFSDIIRCMCFTLHTIIVRLISKLSINWSGQMVRGPCRDCTDNLKQAFYGIRTEPLWLPCRGYTNLLATFQPKIDSFLHNHRTASLRCPCGDRGMPVRYVYRLTIFENLYIIFLTKS